MGLDENKYENLSNQTQSKELRFLRQVQLAKQVLKEGMVVQIAADGHYGVGGIEVPFFGRLRLFKKGFAELAAVTGASVIPMTVIMLSEGEIEVTFNPPLKKSKNGLPA